MTLSDPQWIALAADIRAIDGNHDLGAGALAEALVARGWTLAALSGTPPSLDHAHDPVYVIGVPRSNAFCYGCGFFPLPLDMARAVTDAALNRDHPILAALAYTEPSE